MCWLKESAQSMLDNETDLSQQTTSCVGKAGCVNDNDFALSAWTVTVQVEGILDALSGL